MKLSFSKLWLRSWNVSGGAPTDVSLKSCFGRMRSCSARKAMRRSKDATLKTTCLYGPNRDIAFFIPVGSRPGSVRFARRRKDCRLSAETDMQEYFASVHLRFTRRCSRSNGQDSFG